jgi:ABC-type uncharacterized transport system substrate-binding protein
LAGPIDSAIDQVFIVQGDATPASRQLAEALVRKIPTAKVISRPDAELQRKKTAILIALGEPVFQALLAKNPDSAILAVLISSQAFTIAVESAGRARVKPVSAIFAEASPLNQLRLAAKLGRGNENIVTFLTPRSSYLKPILQRAANQAGLELEIVQLQQSESLTQELDQAAAYRGVLAIPDTTLYTPENIRAALITTYRQNQFVIGYSSSFVKAGALATTYSTIDDIASQTAEVTREYIETGRLPGAQYPKYFETTVNDNVAKSLNIIITNEARNFSNKPRD